MECLYGWILGLLEGLGEFLPISASAHKMAIGAYLPFPEGESARLLAELGALVAALIGCRKTIAALWASLKERANRAKRRRKKPSKEELTTKFLLIAALPAALVLIIRRYYDFAADWSGNFVLAGIGLLLSAGLLFIGDHSLCRKWDATDMSGTHAFKLGLFRTIGQLVPGISPTGATASMGMNMGFSPEFAVEFSILLSIPALLVSVILRIGKLSALSFGVGAAIFLGAALAGLLAIGLVRFLVKKERYGLFFYYCLAAAVVVFIIGAK